MLADRYEVIKEFEAGGFSQTFLAKDLKHPQQRRCVIKKLHPQATDEFTIQASRHFFVKEVNVLHQLGHHAQIPELYNTFYDEQGFYLVEEYIEGQSLAHELQKGKRWKEQKVIDLLKEILTPLTFVHEHGVIHRDLKPANLIRRKQDKSIVLIDFGCVQSPGNEDDTEEAIVGTDGFVAHEQLLGKPTLASDVFTVGMIAIQAITGVNPNRTPFPTHERTGNILWQQHRTVRPELAAEIDKMVCCDVQRRYSSAAAALRAINNLNANLRSGASQSHQRKNGSMLSAFRGLKEHLQF